MYRIAVLGCKGVGKSGFLQRLGGISGRQSVSIEYSASIRLVIEEVVAIDDPGIEQLREEYSDGQRLLKAYLQNSFSNESTADKRLYGYIFMYDLTDKKSITKIRQCAKYITDYERQHDLPVA